ncbi:MAG: hypothetical protein MUD01_03705 [Chloroflexaceae bacterium]|jgi:hypothetical protein|nr:hypothetical protein [Chloroflexaceae bacterium]
MPDAHHQQSQPAFSPHEGRRIIGTYTDAETGLLVISEIAISDPEDRSVYFTLIDPQSGAVISPHTRVQQLGDAEQISVDHEHHLKLIARREVNERTGCEFLIETVIDMQTGQTVATGKSVAFGAQPRTNALERYLERQTEQQAMQRFWADDYPQLSFEAQCSYWMRNLSHAMRSMGEMGQPEYMIFTPANYQEWKTRDAQFDRILRYLVDELPRLFGGDDELTRRMRALLEQS